MEMRFPVTVQYTVRCTVCGDTAKADEFRVLAGYDMLHPYMPDGWAVVVTRGRGVDATDMVCPKHTVKVVTVDA